MPTSKSSGRSSRSKASTARKATSSRKRTSDAEQLRRFLDPREVDRARRAAGVGPAFPILGYDDLTAAQVIERLGDLGAAELRKVRD